VYAVIHNDLVMVERAMSMLSRIDTVERRGRYTPPVEAAGISVRGDDGSDAARKAALRRAMYERIARGNAHAEAEDTARRMWRGE
jgi:hypothetical protein